MQRSRSGGKTLALAVAVSVAFNFSVPAAAQNTTSRYDTVIKQARDGDTSPALGYLSDLLKQDPGNARALYDYVVILGWAGRNADAWALRDRIDIAAAPVYVVSSLAGSARATIQPVAAEKLYRSALLRDPKNLDATIGLAMTLSDMKHADAGIALLKPHLASADNAGKIQIYRAQADIFNANGDHANAAEALRNLLQLQPQNAQVQRDLAGAYRSMGAPGLAFDVLRNVPPAVRDDQWSQAAAERGAAMIRWGQLQTQSENGPTRFAEIDRAIDENAWLIAELSADSKKNAEAIRRARFDRVLALRARVRMREAADLYEALRKDSADIPPYVTIAAADAYLYLEQPQHARDLYLQAQKAGDDDSSLGLFYAYIESEQFDDAYRVVDDKVKHTPKYDYTYEPPPPNEKYLSLRIAQAMVRSYGDQQAAAGRMLDQLNREAPFDSDLRSARAAWMNARGWHLRAETELRTLMQEDPSSTAARIGHAETVLTLRRYRDAEHEINGLAAAYPEDKAVQNLQRLWTIHNMRELQVDTSYGRGSGGTLGNDDFSLEALLYSSPFDYNYRAYSRSYESYADFSGVHAVRRRIGAGLEYSDQTYTVTGEIDHGRDDAADTSANASIEWRPDDYWTARLRADSSVDDIPLRARPLGITARGVDGELTYRFNESSHISGSVGQQNFSDGNRRQQISAAYFQRLITGPRYKLDATVGAYTSRNSVVPTAPYYNPSNDHELDLTLANEWLTWRSYHKDFFQRLVFSGGEYWENGFGAGTTYSVRYEHQWDWQQQFTLRYGLGHSVHPYDGQKEDRNFGYLSLDWRF